MDEGLIGSKQVAFMLGVAHKTFCDWRRARKEVPPGHFLNGRYRYYRAEVEEWIKVRPRARRVG
jgi:predicted DNA-binding transcriptional regulator AlpA